jgi:hypothetical protein
MTMFNQESVNYIESIDFTMMRDKMVAHNGWKLSEVEQGIRLYRNYLILHLKYPDEKLAPSECIDEVWHNHILDTHKYRDDCENIFGKYLDHYPYFGIDVHSNLDDNAKAFERMQELHAREFGYQVPRIRYPFFLRWLARFTHP